MFCFGLLRQFDICQIAALVAPRRVEFSQPSERARKELASLAAWYRLFGAEHAPLDEPNRSANESDPHKFPAELVRFTADPNNPVFAGSGTNTWDRMIRERGYLLFEEGTYHLWYTGYRGAREDIKQLGYATSKDGIHWQRDSENPIFTGSWVEDMCVVRHEGIYSMFAEGAQDRAHLLTSTDRRKWTDHGALDVRQTGGKPIAPGPYGTPTVWVENGTWYLFYERGDAGVWLATSHDRDVWTNVQDDPVIACGPDAYDRKAVALDQVIKYQGRYFGYYHATAHDPWKDWTTNVAVSDDLIHWTKYSGNPIVKGNKSSGIVVFDGAQWILYTMHPEMWRYVSQRASATAP